MENKKSIGSWRGKPFEDLSKEELLVVIKALGAEIESLRKERDRLFQDSSPFYIKGKG